jgi:uncharacterized protein (DUF433 family)
MLKEKGVSKKLENNINSRAAIYQELCDSYRAIDDFRAKLLGFLPFATGTGILLLVRTDIQAVNDGTKPFFLAVGAFGFFITLGLLFYEVYGVKKCHALINAGKELEEDLGIDSQRGQFTARPREVARLINEPFASGTIYPAVLAAWTYVALFSESEDMRWWALWWAIGVFVIGFTVVLFFNLKLGMESDIRKVLKISEEREVMISDALKYLRIKARPRKSTIARNDPVVSRDPEVMHGEVVFTGTRVPAKTLEDYIEAGHTLGDFLEGFPSVRREAAEAYLGMISRPPTLRVLLDENVDRRLKGAFHEQHAVSTVPGRGWTGKKFGELLEAAEKEFDAFVTTERDIPYQQNISQFDLAVVVVEAKNNTYEDLASLMERANAALGDVVPGEATRICV